VTDHRDKQLPEDFDPTALVDEPMNPVEQPSERDKAEHQDDGAKRNGPDHVEEFMHFLPTSLKRFIVAGSCCTGVAALYFLTSWDHGWIPGVEGQFALASDLRKSNQEMASMKYEVTELYLLGIASSIRDLQAEMCTAPSRAKATELDRLQQKYKEKTGDRYPERQTC
jgi:hypothetical protein